MLQGTRLQAPSIAVGPKAPQTCPSPHPELGRDFLASREMLEMKCEKFYNKDKIRNLTDTLLATMTILSSYQKES